MRSKSLGNSIILVSIVVAIILLVGGFFLFAREATGPADNKTNALFNEDPGNTTVPRNQTSKQIKPPHFVDSSPSHNETYAAVPLNIVINFNFDLSEKSSMKIEVNGKDVGEGKTTVDNTKLTLRRKISQTAGDEIYTVKYSACWPDDSCHDGEFRFVVDSKTKSSYTDTRGKSEVQISLKNIAFSPAKVIISKGTKVIWTNDEAVGHYVNTDPHPSHTFYLGQNSKLLN